MPEWLDEAPHDWKVARGSYAVILLAGAPIWQIRVWYLDWGSGVGGYVSNFEAVFSKDQTSTRDSSIERWETTTWAAGLARLINFFSASGDFHTFDPTLSLVPQPSTLHPIDAARMGY